MHAVCPLALCGAWHTMMRMGMLKEDTERGVHHHITAPHAAAGTKSPLGAAEEAGLNKVRQVPGKGTR